MWDNKVVSIPQNIAQVSGINFKHSSLKSKELESPRSPRCSSPAWRRPGPSGRLGHGLLLGLSLVLVTVVLEPDLHLRIRTRYFSANFGWLRFNLALAFLACQLKTS